jgi:PAS domain S-box-containing protein
MSELINHQQPTDKVSLRNKAIIDANPDMLIVVSGTGQIIDFLPGTPNILNLFTETCTGKKLDNLFPPDVSLGIMKQMNRLLTEGNAENYNFQIGAGSHTKFFESRFVLYGCTEVLIIVRDISDQRKAECALVRKGKILEAVASASQSLLRDDSLEEAVNEALQTIGNATGQDRVYIFEFHQNENFDQLLTSQRFEWVKQGILPQIQNPSLQNLIVSEAMPRWYDSFLSGGHIEGNIRDFPLNERINLESQDIISIVAVPVIVENKCVGFAGFDNCHSESDWSGDEIAILKVLASSFGMAMIKQLRKNELDKTIRFMEEREERFRLIINNSSDVLGIINQDGTYQYISESVQKISGLLNTELQGSSFLDYVHPDDKRKVYRSFIESLENPGIVLILQYRLKHMHLGWVHVEAVGLNLIDQPSIKGILVSIRNIASRKEAELALKKSEERYSMVLNATEQGIWDWDLHTNEVFYSAQWKQQLGYKDHELKNEFDTWLNLLHPEDKVKSINAVNSYLENPTDRFILEFRLRHKDGTYRSIHNNAASIVDNGKVVRMFGAHTDITERKSAESALKESESFRSTLLESMPIPFFYKDRNGRYLGFNRAFELFFGNSREALIGKSVYDINPPELADIYHKKDQELFEKIDNQVYESQVKNAQGEIRDVIFHKATLCDARNQIIGLMGTILDITERKKAESALKASEQNYKSLMELFRNLADNMPDMIWAKDLDKKYIFVNKAICTKLLNAKNTKEPIGKTDMFFAERERQSHPEYPEWHTFGEICENSDDIVMKTCQSGQFDESGNVKNQFLFLDVVKSPFLNEHGELIGTVGSGRDVTDRKRDEKILNIQYNIALAMVSLNKLEDLLQFVADELSKLIDTTNFFVALYNKETDKMKQVIWKDEVDDYLEWNADNSISGQVVKQGRTLLLNREESDRLGRDLGIELLGTPSECWLGVPLKINNQSYGAIVIQNYTNPNAYDTSTASLLEMISHLISMFIENQRILDDLVLAKDKAEESERLKTAFLQNMSHEIRTPMNAISGFSQMLQNPFLTMEKRENYTSIIINSTNQLLSIVNNILTISAIETKQEKACIDIINVNEIICDLNAIFRIQALNKGVSFFMKTGMTDDDAFIYGDKTKITQILSNLLINAFKFTHQGYIEFGYNQWKDEPNRAVQPILEFFVKDTGIGIKPEVQKTIFDRFMQADKSIQYEYGGAGLGLSISKGLAEILGGHIRLESEPGKGSVFFFDMPYQVAEKISRSKPVSPDIEKENTILVAEDQENNYLLIQELLSHTKLKLIWAHDGKEALELCQQNPQIELVLMDIKMPVMDGHTAAIEIKKLLPGLPVIALSAYALETEIQIYKDEAFDDYITKPVNPDELLMKIKNYIALQ